MRDFTTWIEKRPNGPKIYVARTRLPDGSKGPSKAFEKHAQARGWCDSQAVAWREHRFIDPKESEILFGSWAEQVVRQQIENGDTTRQRKEIDLRLWLRPAFEQSPLGTIRAAAIRRWLADMLEEGCAPGTVGLRLRLMHQIMEAAVQDGRLGRNPCAGIERPKDPSGERRFLTLEELQRLAGTIHPWFSAWVLALGAGGFRIGESLALRGRDVDPFNSSITVAGNLQSLKTGDRIVRYAKTRASLRTIRMPAWAMDPIRSQIAERSIKPDDLLFTGTRNGHLSAGHVRKRYFDPAAEKAALVPLTPHALRHTAVSLWIATGANAKEVQTRAGHASIKITYDLYGHLFPGFDQSVADGLDQMWAAASPSSNVVAIR